MTDTSQTSLAYIAESTYGTTPATPVFKQLRFLSESFKVETSYVNSNEIRSDRNVADVTLVAREANGGFGFELTYGSFDDILEALLQGTWSTNVLKNGTTFRSFTFEKLMRPSAGNQYHRFVGQVANTMSLNIKARDIVTGNFGFIGKDASSAQAIISGATYTAPNTNPVMNSSSFLQGLAITGITTPQATELNLNIDNNLRQQPVLGSLNSKGIGSGRFNVSGDITLYFETQAAYELFLADTTTDMTVTIGGSSNLKYAINLPKLKFTDGEVVSGQNDQDVMIKMPFTGYYDGTNAASLKITRTP